MFCPKCGAQVPDTAAVCPKCGNRFAVKRDAGAPRPSVVKAPVAGGAKHAASSAAFTSAVKSLNSKVLITLILGVVAIVCMFLPWLEVSPDLSGTSATLAGIADGLGSLTGQTSNYSSHVLNEAYAPWQLFGLPQTVEMYFGTRSNTYAVASLLGFFGIPAILIMIVLVVGVIMGFASKGKNEIVLTLGFAALIFDGALWLFFASLDAWSPIGNGMTVFPVLCLICSIAGVAMVIVSRKERLGK